MEILFLAVLTLLNALFAMSEMAVVSSRKSRLQHMADEGSLGASAALKLADDPTPFLSTVQVGITLIGVTSGAFGEAALTRGLADWVSRWPTIAAHSETIAFGIVITGITLTSLILGELVPKRLALLNPEATASLVSRPMRVLSAVTHPLVRLLSLTTDGILKLFRVRGADERPVTQDEINVLMEQGTEAGVFEEHEQRMVNRVFRMDELRVAGIMTPRGNIAYLDLDESMDENAKRIIEAGHSRFPVTRGGLRHIEGVVLAKSLLERALRGEPLAFNDPARPVFVPVTLSVTELIATFKKNRQTIAFVVNEHGDTVGLVTLNDVMEALVGDIATVEDDSERDIVQRDDHSWLVDGNVTIERFRDVLDIDAPLPEEELGSYHTIAGFALLRLDRVPRVADRFQWDDLTFEIVDMDGNRIDKLLVTRERAPAA